MELKSIRKNKHVHFYKHCENNYNKACTRSCTNKGEEVFKNKDTLYLHTVTQNMNYLLADVFISFLN